MTTKDWQVIIQIGAEGGDLTLYGRKAPTGWEFTREVVDQSAAMLDEAAIHHASKVATTFEEALCLLDRYPWFRLYPLKVHPDFAKAILVAARERIVALGGHALRNLERWERVCSQKDS
jgi:hypothetical protein